MSPFLVARFNVILVLGVAAQESVKGCHKIRSGEDSPFALTRAVSLVILV